MRRSFCPQRVRGGANWAERVKVAIIQLAARAVNDRHCHSCFARSNSRRRSSECFVHNLSGWAPRAILRRSHAQRKLLCMAYFTWGGETSRKRKFSHSRVNKWLPAQKTRNNFPDTSGYNFTPKTLFDEFCTALWNFPIEFEATKTKLTVQKITRSMKVTEMRNWICFSIFSVFVSKLWSIRSCTLSKAAQPTIELHIANFHSS